MRKSVFLKHIEQLDEEDLRSELSQLFDNIAEVRAFYKMELGSIKDRSKFYDKIKQDIAAKYKSRSRRRPRRPRIRKVQAILSRIEKISVFDHELIDVYLFDVGEALGFARSYDYFSQVLFNNITSSYKNALERIEHNRMQDDFIERCTELLALGRFIPELHREMKKSFDSCFTN